MTVGDLIKELQSYPEDAPVTRADVTVKFANMTSKLIVRLPPKEKS